MKLFLMVVICFTLSGCVVGEGRDPLTIPMIPKYDSELAHKCQMDSYRPECSVN